MHRVARGSLAIAPLSIIGLLASPASSGNTDEQPLAEIVRIDTGVIRGAALTGLLIYKGIPYAASPEGNLRWRPPQPGERWEGVRDATQFAPACMQPVPEAVRKSVRMSEDCLYLNVWTPANSATAKLPVMVWIHGGGFRVGTGSNVVFDGAALATQGVVVVTLNYRLGPFGLFAHPAIRNGRGEPTANYHLMDQIAALQWVRRNIDRFGGDHDAVTVFGESAGGSSVLALMVSPQGRGLFQRAIVQSGTLFTRTLSEAQADYEALVNSSEAAAGLRTAVAGDILDKLQPASFAPVIDGVLIPEEPLRAFNAGRQAPVPLIISVTNDEGSLLRPSGLTPEAVLARVKADDRQLDVLYPGLSKASGELARAVYDDLFYGAQARLLASLTQRSGRPAYLYEFAYVPEQLRGDVPAAPHGIDVPFVFRNKHPRLPMNDSDMRMAASISEFWLQFARSGNPNPPGIERWHKYDADTDHWMVFENDGPALRTHHRKARLDFCEQFLISAK
jgi:para-nitrobenzyl esterase